MAAKKVAAKRTAPKAAKKKPVPETAGWQEGPKTIYETVHEALSVIYGHPEGEHALNDALMARSMARWLLDTRLTKGLSQADVAKAMGTNQVAVSRFENSVVPDPTLSFLIGYARALGCEVDLTIEPPKAEEADFDVKPGDLRVEDV
jgi:DNA-binding XRE family transcriptional regulator